MKKVIAIVVFLLCLLDAKTQNYIKLADVSGVKATSNQMAELQTAANAVVAALPSEFQSQFKVYDMGFYIYNEFMVGMSTPAIWDNALANISSPYYLAFGRESDQNGNFNQIRVELKLPKTGAFQCIDETYLEIIKNSVKLPTQTLLKNGVAIGDFSAHAEAERTSIYNLKTYITRVVNCCNNGTWNPGCGNCRYDFNEIKTMLASKHFVRLESANTIVSDFTYSSIQSSKKIVCTIFDEVVNYTDDLQEIASQNGGQVKIVVREIKNTSCEQANNFQEIEHDHAYTEDVVIVNWDGHIEVYTKISTSENSRMILPWLAAEAVKRIAMAAVGGIIEIGITTLIEYFIGNHSTFKSAWDAAQIDWFEVAGAAAEGAFSEAKYAGILIAALKPVVKWIIITPYSLYAKGIDSDSREGPAWITQLGKKLIESSGEAILYEVLLKRVSKLKDAIIKKSAVLNSRLSGKLGTVIADLAVNPKNARLFKRWDELSSVLMAFSVNSAKIKDGDYLEKVMNAVKNGDPFKITKQKLGYPHHPADKLKDNIAAYKKAKGVTNYTKPAGYESHHIVPGGKTSVVLEKLRKKLDDLGIDINEGVQGVDLPKNIHNYTKTIKYDNDLAKLLSTKNTQTEVRQELERIGNLLANGLDLFGKPI